MPRYRFWLPVRSLTYYRLPDEGATAESVTITPAVEPTYTAQIDAIADNAATAYEQAQQHVEHFLGYLALLGEASGFIIDGRTGLRARNLDILENPPPLDQPPPPFEAIGGVIFPAGQEALAAQMDPDGVLRRGGRILVFNSQVTMTPGAAGVAEVCELFAHRGGVPQRVRIAVGILHDAACALEPANAFAQTFTALEVLTEHLRPSNVLDVFFQTPPEGELPYKTRAAMLNGLRKFFAEAKVPDAMADRLVSYVSTTQSKSQIDIFRDYLADLGIAVDRPTVSNWRTVRGALVHAADQGHAQEATIRAFRDVVRRAVHEELRRAAA